MNPTRPTATAITATVDDVDLFEELGLDSMDRLNIMTAISESTVVEIPDDRYSAFTSMRALIGHVS